MQQAVIWYCCAMQVIVDKMVDYLRTTNDEVTKTEVVKRIGELAERFAPDTQWFLDTMNQVCTYMVLIYWSQLALQDFEIALERHTLLEARHPCIVDCRAASA